jgi:hypothetical protein
LEEACEPFDIHRPEQVREGAAEGEPVLQRIARARRRLRAIVQDPPAPVRSAAEIGGVDLELAGAGRALQGAQIVGTAGDGGGWQCAVGHQLAWPVDVAEHGIEQLRALGDSCGDHLPFLPGKHEWRMIQRPGALAGERIALVEIAMDAIGDAGVAHMPVGEAEAALQLVGRERRPFGQERLPVRPDRAVRRHQLVIGAGQRPVARKQGVAALAAGPCRTRSALQSHA